MPSTSWRSTVEASRRIGGAGRANPRPDQTRRSSGLYVAVEGIADGKQCDARRRSRQVDLAGGNQLRDHRVHVSLGHGQRPVTGHQRQLEHVAA